MPSKKRKIGDKGETICVDYLLNKGFKVTDRNYLKKYGELDIVAMRNKRLHFFEVKTTRGYFTSREDALGQYGPEENVHHAKRQRLRKTISVYLEEKKYNITSTEWSFHVLVVYLDETNHKAYIKKITNVIL